MSREDLRSLFMHIADCTVASLPGRPVGLGCSPSFGTFGSIDLPVDGKVYGPIAESSDSLRPSCRGRREMGIGGKFLPDSDRGSRMSGWRWGWMSCGSLFWAGAIGLVAWAVIRNREMMSPSVERETAPKVDPRAISGPPVCPGRNLGAGIHSTMRRPPGMNRAREMAMSKCR